MKKLVNFMIASMILFSPILLLAQTPAPTVPPVVNQVQTTVGGATVTADAFFANIAAAMPGFSALNTWFKIALVLLLLDCSLKVSFLTPLWNKLGTKFDSLAPVVFSLLAGLCLMAGTNGLSLKGVLSYLSVGVGASGLAAIITDLSGSIKNPTVLSFLNFLKGILGGNTPTPPVPPTPPTTPPAAS
jgi:hypothetical protein